jgi:hypothetical protein
MTTFDEREHAFEEKHFHDEELRFKAKARRDKRLGLWAAEKLGKAGAAAEDYATRLIAAEIQKDSAGAIFKTIRDDFDRAKVAVTDQEIRKKMDELLAAAVKEITKGTAANR